jgi:hypothetical protein
MNFAVNKILIAATISLSMVLIVSTAFAQAMMSDTSLGFDTAGAPGTEAPASPVPIGKISSDWMSHENAALISTRSTFSLPTRNQVQAEERARLEENQLVRQLALARSQGRDVDPAARNQWLGTVSLARGDRTMAENYFRRAEEDLRTGKSTTRHADALGLGDDPNAVNFHPNSGTATAY